VFNHKLCGYALQAPRILNKEGKYGSQESKEKEEVSLEQEKKFPPFPRPAPPSGPFCFHVRVNF